MSYQDRYKGRKLKDPPSYLGRFGLFILVGAAFAAFVGSLRGLDSSLCALATLCVVACKLLVELIATKSHLQLPERFARLPLAVWLLFWLLPVPPLWFVLRTIWPKNADPNGAIGVLTVVCLVLYVPTMLAVIKPIDKEAAGNKKDVEDKSGQIDFNVDFNAADQSERPDDQVEKSGTILKAAKTKHKPKKKKK
ncbi:MAG: hypothetical protein IT342_08100 [Candidatus Melainabacteria bacterium]|nr:hypothetical protein [Candidatus Melainabacteria bacterium]